MVEVKERRVRVTLTLFPLGGYIPKVKKQGRTKEQVNLLLNDASKNAADSFAGGVLCQDRLKKDLLLIRN